VSLKPRPDDQEFGPVRSLKASPVYIAWPTTRSQEWCHLKRSIK